MKYAIIAAGCGNRLSKEGVKLPKPLVNIAGEPLLNRLLRIFTENHADEIVVICNEEMTTVQAHLKKIQHNGLNGTAIPLKVIIKSTPSSMHSLFALRPYLAHSPFCLTTVDTIFNEKAFNIYIKNFETKLSNGVDAYMGVTSFIDDEKPLYVETNQQMRIVGFHDTPVNNCQYVSGGIYGLHPHIFTTLQQCIDRGEQRMRNFQRALIANHYMVMAHDLGKILDIDHAQDIAKAETFLQQEKRK